MTILRRRRSTASDSGPSFGSVWKVFVGIMSGVMTAAILALGAWVWNTSESVTKLTMAVEANTAASKDLGSRLDRLADVAANHGGAISNIQTLQTAQAAAFGDRIRSLEFQVRGGFQQGRR